MADPKPKIHTKVEALGFRLTDYTICFIREALQEFGLPEDGYLDKLLSAVRRRAA